MSLHEPKDLFGLQVKTSKTAMLGAETPPVFPFSPAEGGFDNLPKQGKLTLPWQ